MASLPPGLNFATASYSLKELVQDLGIRVKSLTEEERKAMSKTLALAQPFLNDLEAK